MKTEGTWIDVALDGEIPNLGRKTINIEGTPVLILRVDNIYYAIEDRCTHEDRPLNEGYIEGNTITCPFHGAQFCIKTGEVKAPPAFVDLPIFPVRVYNQKVQVLI